MYYSVLAQMLPSAHDATEEEEICEQFRSIIGTIVAAAEPLSMNSLADLLGVDLHAIETCLNPLHSVLWVPQDFDVPVRPLHLSFGEYLCSDDLGDPRFRINPAAVHRDLFRKCLQLLSRSGGLHENMCDLRFPGQLRHELAAHTVEQRLSPAIQYACRYWIHHLQHSETKIYDHDIVYSFLRQHFLHWLEALSLLNRLGDSLRDIDALQSLISLQDSFRITTFLEDARRFVLANRYICERAPLQLYSSAIVFAPQSSVVKQVCGKVPGWIKQCPIPPRTWNAELQKLEGHTGSVSAVAFSPDGSQLASASDDKTVRLWDAKTGHEVQRLEGHTDPVNAVAFSPDGSQLASASRDKTVRQWDAKTGHEVQRLEGHTDPVNAVAFSPDGSQLASASRDKTIRLWDAKTGHEVQRLEGYTGPVNAVAFSPDGLQLASASRDKTIRLWDAKTGHEVQRLEGHTDPVNAVAFSPDGSQLASASYGKTVRQWDAKTGHEVQRLEGHTHWVNAVAFSPDGSQLASASHDETVRLWDAKTGHEVQRLEGHTGPVIAIAFSPDGSQLASASYDETVRLWDAKTGHEVQRLERHTSEVDAVAFSPEGSQLASASYNKTVRAWIAGTGDETQLLENHTLITAIDFTSDSQALLTNRGRIHIGAAPSMPGTRKFGASNNLLLRDEWLECGNKRVLWLPHEYRSRVSAVHGNRLAIACRTGLLAFLEIQYA